MATNSGGWLYESNGTPVDKATADNAQARVLEIKQSAVNASADATKALQTANAYAGQIAQANTTAGEAKGIAQGAEGTADNAASRVDALEVMGGVQPGSVNDAEMKLHAEQDGGLFNTALKAQSVQAVEAGGAARPTLDSVFERGVSVTDPRFGATVGTGGDDTAAFTAAIQHAATSANGGGQVHIPNGSFRIGNVTVPDKVHISGEGQRASKVTATATGAALTIGTESVLSGFYLTGTKIAGGTGVKFRPASYHATLREMSVTGHERGVDVDSSWIIQLRDTQIQSCTAGLIFTRTTRAYGSNIVHVSGGEVQGCVDGVVVEATGNYGLKFIGTTVEGNSGKGFAINGSTYGLSLRDVYMESNQGGHVAFGGSGHYGPTINGALFLNSATYGVNIPDGVLVEDISIQDSTFNLHTPGVRQMYLGTGVKGFNEGPNHTLGGSLGKFDPAVDFKGQWLTHQASGRTTYRPSAATQSQGGASLNIQQGVAPTTPNDGDVWTTTGGLFARTGGSTGGPLPIATWMTASTGLLTITGASTLPIGQVRSGRSRLRMAIHDWTVRRTSGAGSARLALYDIVAGTEVWTSEVATTMSSKRSTLTGDVPQAIELVATTANRALEWRVITTVEFTGNVQVTYGWTD